MGEVSDQLWTRWNIAVMIIGAIFSAIFVVLLLYHFVARKRAKDVMKILAYSSVLHIVAWFVHFVASMTTYMKTDDNRANKHDAANYTICAMVTLHPIFFYIFVINRLNATFRDSVLKLTWTEIVPVAIGVSVTVLATALEQISWILIVYGAEPIISIENLAKPIWVYISFDVATRMLVSYLFVRKLFLMVVGQSDDEQMRSTSSISRPEASKSTGSVDKDQTQHKEPAVQFNKFQKQFLSVIRRFTLLGVFTSLPMAIAKIIFVLDYVAVKGMFTHENWISYNTLQMVAVSLEGFAIVLSFSFNQPLYYACCKFCDAGCAKCWEKRTEQKILRVASVSLHKETSMSPAPAQSQPTVEMNNSVNSAPVQSEAQEEVP